MGREGISPETLESCPFSFSLDRSVHRKTSKKGNRRNKGERRRRGGMRGRILVIG